ncbi:2-phosphosulfolactate phosphatase, partial [Streptomyces sp. NPDC055509]
MDSRVVGIPDVDGTEQVAVVIDVMRAFTTAAWAFHRGADKIVLAADEGEALEIKAGHPGWLALKDGAPVSGFDLVNSPGLLQEADLAGRTLIQKTTAGTVGALAVVEAQQGWWGPLDRGWATAPARIVCRGDNGKVV